MTNNWQWDKKSYTHGYPYPIEKLMSSNYMPKIGSLQPAKDRSKKYSEYVEAALDDLIEMLEDTKHPSRLRRKAWESIYRNEYMFYWSVDFGDTGCGTFGRLARTKNYYEVSLCSPGRSRVLARKAIEPSKKRWLPAAWTNTVLPADSPFDALE